MLFTLFVVYLVHCASAEEKSTKIIPSCSDAPGPRMTFTPVEGFLGRYRAEYCTRQNNTSEEWVLQLAYFESRSYCNSSRHVVTPGSSHSTNYEWISKEHNCTAHQTVCMSAIFDLVFSACYCISSQFSGLGAPSHFYFNVTNDYTKEFFHHNQANVDTAYHPKDMAVTWHTGVPLQAYSVEICNQLELNDCKVVPPSNCSRVDAWTLKCRLAPAAGCHRLYLAHEAPWINGLYGNQSSVIFDFCRNGTSVSAAGAGAWGGWAWAGAGGCALLAAAALAVRGLARALARGKLKQKVQASWLHHTHRHEESLTSQTPKPGAPRSVLVLYARECAAAERAVGSLLGALRQLVPGQVYDIHSPAVLSLCAGAPAEWVRGVLARPDCAVLLLQTPALHALYNTHSCTPDVHHLVSPLLGRRVCARAPRYGDALLQLALRLIAEQPRVPSAPAYRKYYIATISALATEVLPCVVPYARYPLPAAADVLLRDLAGAAGPVPLGDFPARLREFVDYARDHPDYLLDELVLIDS